MLTVSRVFMSACIAAAGVPVKRRPCSSVARHAGGRSVASRCRASVWAVCWSLPLSEIGFVLARRTVPVALCASVLSVPPSKSKGALPASVIVRL